MSLAKILLVDDNEDMRETLQLGLEREGYSVTTAESAKTLMEKLPANQPDVILLDLMLPDANGLTLIGDIHKHTNAPVIVISGKGEMVDKVVGLEMGADDYICKPFAIQELAARIKAHLRRQTRAAPAGASSASEPEDDKIAFGEWTIDRSRFQVYGLDNASANLTVKEYRLLEVLIAAPNRVLSREQLLDKSRADDFSVTDRAIDTQITRIRKKLNDEEARVIQSVRGIGYMFVPPAA